MSSTPSLDAPSGDPSRGPATTKNGGESTAPSIDSGAQVAIPNRTWPYRFVSALFLCALGAGIWVTREKWQPVVDGWIRPATASKRPMNRPPLVGTADVIRKPMKQFLNCLGTVTAFNNVVVRSRVDGELVEVLFDEGQMVQAGQKLARVDPRIFEAARDQAEGQYQRDVAALELAKLNFDRAKNLSADDALSQQERDQLEAAYKQAQAVVEVDRAILANATLQLEYCEILAPITGRVGLRVLDQGNMVQANDVRGLALITQLQPISVIFPIPQDEIPRVKQQLAISSSIPVMAYDRSFQNLLAEGRLTAIDNQVDPTTGTLKLKAVFDNQDDSLFPNQFVNIRLLVRDLQDALVVPSTAIQRNSDFLYVYVVQSDASVEIAKVTVAFQEGGLTVIESGLDAGMRVVTEGTDKLQPGAKVSLPEDRKPEDRKPEEGKRSAVT